MARSTPTATGGARTPRSASSAGYDNTARYTELTGPPQGSPIPTNRAGLGCFSLLMVAFFWVSGGIYGNEALLFYASPGHILIVMLGAAFVYGLPLALISTELASAMPFDGGAVAWVEEAFGTGLGAHNTYWLWVCYSLDAAIYPVFAAEYIVQHWDVWGLHYEKYDEQDEWVGYEGFGIPILAMSMIILVSIIQLTGTEVLVSLNTVLATISLIPTFIFIVWGLPGINWKEFSDTAMPEETAGTDWSVLFSWSIWLYQGFISLGALSGEVENPAKTMPLVVMALTPLLVFLNIMPLAVAWGYDSNYTNYVPGHFDELARTYMAEWLGWCFLAGSIMCQLGLLNSTMMAAERMLYFFLQTRFPATFAPDTEPTNSVFNYLFVDPTPGVPAGLIILNGAVGCLAVWIPYAALIETTVLLAAPSITLLLIAFTHFKRTRPHMERPYNIAGGVPGSIALLVFPMAMTVTQVYLTVTDATPVLEVPYFKLLVLLGVVGTGGFVHLVHDLHSYGLRGLVSRLVHRDRSDESTLLFSAADARKESKETQPVSFNGLYT